MEALIKDITPENLSDIPEGCRSCIYWKYPEDFEKVRLIGGSKRHKFCVERKKAFMSKKKWF